MKAAIFDFNGTLFDDTIFHIMGWQSFMRKRFGIELTEAQVLAGFVGPSNPDIFRNYFGEGRFTADEIHQFAYEKEVEYRAAVRSLPDRMRLMEGAPELFDYLVAHEIPFALATASEIENINFYMEDLGLGKWFSMDRIIYENGTLRSKPAPDFYLEAARRLGFAPGDCLVFEDSPTGIQAAVNAGIGRIVAIDRGSHRNWLESRPEIHAIVHDFFGCEQYL